MVSLDDAVIARFEKFGKKFELFVDPDLVELWKTNNDAIEISKLLAIEDVFHDARDGERPTAEVLEKVFNTLKITEIATRIISEGEIQLADAIDIKAKSGSVGSIRINGLRFDCGSIDGFLAAISHVSNLLHS